MEVLKDKRRKREKRRAGERGGKQEEGDGEVKKKR